ncbi:MAG: YggS family pyridoxal phosphate-dependent enzyme [Fimbriimonadales bacterium]|nr:YggS family pyridoxal phosphate-dependent enzyme [Fimbriimonadales bacterium]
MAGRQRHDGCSLGARADHGVGRRPTLSRSSEVFVAFERVRERIAEAARSVGRAPEEITLVAVTKSVPIERIQEAFEAGCRVFGESRFQEALPKIARLPSDIEWHFIGKLQSNKARRVASAFRVIHTLESESQLRELSKLTEPVDALIEVNVAKEPQKAGVLPEDLDEFWDLASQCRSVRVRGLMTIGPNLGEPEAMRPYFARLRKLAERFGCRWLSMGMSSDFDVAIQEGATHVRVGTAIFGDRPAH